MGRVCTVEEDGTPTSILASDPALDIDLELLLVLLGRQAEAWRQEMASLQRTSGTPQGVVPAYDWMCGRLQKILNKVSEEMKLASSLERTSSGGLYKRAALQKMEELKEWASDEIGFSSDPRFSDNTFVQTRNRFSRTLLDILEEFI